MKWERVSRSKLDHLIAIDLYKNKYMRLFALVMIFVVLFGTFRSSHSNTEAEIGLYMRYSHHTSRFYNSHYKIDEIPLDDYIIDVFSNVAKRDRQILFVEIVATISMLSHKPLMMAHRRTCDNTVCKECSKVFYIVRSKITVSRDIHRRVFGRCQHPV